MKPEVLVFGASSSAPVMARFDDEVLATIFRRWPSQIATSPAAGSARHARRLQYRYRRHHRPPGGAAACARNRRRARHRRRRVGLPATLARGKVAGIFGFGRIGEAIEQRLEAFGMTVRCYQRSDVAGTRAARSASLLVIRRLMSAQPNKVWQSGRTLQEPSGDNMNTRKLLSGLISVE